MISRKRRKIWLSLLALIWGVPLLAGLEMMGPGCCAPEQLWLEALDAGARIKAGKPSARPRVIFVGGSALVFGVRSSLIEKSVDTTVINYGLHAGLGLEVITHRAAKFIRPGDTVVFAPELAHFRRSFPLNEPLRSDWLRRVDSSAPIPQTPFLRRCLLVARGRCWRLWRHWERRCRSLVPGFQESAQRRVYLPEAIGVDGELQIDLQQSASDRKRKSLPIIHPQAFDWEDSVGAMAIRGLSQACQKVDATLWVMPAMRALPASTKLSYGQAYLAREEEWLSRAVQAGAQRLLPAEQHVLTEDYVFDTWNHLNTAGAVIMSERLAEALRLVLCSKE